jgi:protein SCO1/2
MSVDLRPRVPLLPVWLMLVFAAHVAAAAPQVLVSSKPVHSLVAGLIEGVGEAALLIDGTEDPRVYRPDAADRERIRNADLLIWVGPELEPGLAAALAQAPPPGRVAEVLGNDELKILPARADADLRDPFFWLDSRNMLILLDALGRLLSDLDPQHAAHFERNRRRLQSAIAGIDRTLEFGYRDVSGVPVVTYHDTHRYFAQAYAMNLVGTVADPLGVDGQDTARLLKLRSLIADAGVACLFTERAFAEPHLALVLAGTNVNPVELDSLGSDLAPGADLYVELMRRNFERIAQCVRPAGGTTAAPSQAPRPDVADFPDRVIPRYLLADQYGRSVSNRDFQGQLQLIFFGYTYCPDVCPTSLAVMAQALRLLGEDAEQIQPIFITVDPQRDTPALLAEYVAYFHPRMLGLSGSPEVTRRIAELFRARYARVPAHNGDPERYTMDHTSSLYLLGRDGEFITKLAHGLPPAEVAQRLRGYLAQ